MAGVVGMSVPYFHRGPMAPTQMMRNVFGDNFFYILYFQPVGPAEAELEADPRRLMARILWSASGDGVSASSRLRRLLNLNRNRRSPRSLQRNRLLRRNRARPQRLRQRQ